MLGRRQEAGDTLVEVIFSFAVFSLVIVSSLTLMGQGIAMSQRSLEVTLVRQQIDNQVTMVRQAQESNSSAWTDLKGPNNSRVVSDIPVFEVPDRCPEATELAVGDAAQFLGIDSSTKVVRRYAANNSANFAKPGVYSKVDVTGADNSGVPKAYGLWLVLARAEHTTGPTGSIAYDLHVRACWDSVGLTKPMMIGTVVRLYGVN